MRYLPVASRSYVERYLPEGFTALAAEAPLLAWNRDDALQTCWSAKLFVVPSSDRRISSRPRRASPARSAQGWGGGIFPEKLAAAELASGSVVRISDVHLDIPLFWECWKLDSPMVKRINDVVQSAAAGLRRRPQ
jgi:LysR family transcriptional regulator (chromosome initiation inhibitor)